LPTNVRIDTGVEQGDAVTPFYDPMVAKLIVHAPSRRAAAAQLAAACAQVEVWPVKTNAAFLARAAAHPEFVSGKVDTGFIETHLTRLVPEQAVPSEVFVAAASARLATFREPGTPWGAVSGFRLNAAPERQVEVQLGHERELVVLDKPESGALSCVRVGAETVVFARGEAYVFTEPQSRGSEAGALGDGSIRSPMPGKVLAVLVAEGAVVVKGQALVTVEAMKMEHTLTAPFEGTVADLAYKPGDQVSEGAVMLRITGEST
jgi:3-methylcrotonyl-CoA carboxylase alpha subunit